MGEGEFSSLALCYLKKSPTSGENILEQKNAYLATETLTYVRSKVFAIVYPKELPRVFYSNPFDTKELNSHSHALIPEARHLLESSTLLSGEFYLEEISKFDIFHR